MGRQYSAHVPLQDRRRSTLDEDTDLWFSVGARGLLASILIALGALGVGWLAPASPMASDAVLTAFRDSAAGSVVAKALVIVGAGLMLHVWLTTARASRTTSVSEARRLGAMAVVWAVPLMVVPVLFSRDVFSYIAASRLAPAGIDPYAEGTGALPTFWRDGADPMWQDSPSPYGPLWTGLSSVVFHLTEAQPVAALMAFRLMALVGVVLLVVFVPRLAELAGANPGRATWLAVLNPLVLFHLSASAHNDALMAGLLVTGLAVALQQRPVLAVVLISAAGAVKAPALLALPFVGLLWAGRDASWSGIVTAWSKVAGLAASTLAALTVASGVGWGWVGNLSTPTTVDTWLSPPTAVGRVLGLVAETLDGPSAEDVLAGTRTAALVLAALIIAALLLSFRRRGVLRSLALAMVVLVALGPVVHPWYLLWAIPLVAVLTLSRVEKNLAIGVTVGLSIYSVANTGATTNAVATLPDGLAAALSAVVLIAAVAASRGVRPRLSQPAPAQVDTLETQGGAVARS